ncbi:hypothetical protein [Roseobacter sp. HKCCA0434]|uniref:hypothetical protein n=1 Tax=Roseobacter sp. HKCCA0434 TaxID=3079297 RepID=UPI002905E55D|nr:hypothetical protein [Roseobacter sp. HKCCA0434]
MSFVERVLAAIEVFATGRNLSILREIAAATGRSTLVLAGMTRDEIVESIRAAGIPLSDVPDHVANALGLVRAR